MTAFETCRDGNCNPYTCPVCAQEPSPDPDILPDPDSLDRRAARMWARACTLVATTIREELGSASSTRVAEDLEQRARGYADRAEGAA